MKQIVKINLGFIAAIMLLLVFAGGWFYMVIWRPHRMLSGADDGGVWVETASDEEVRALCHHIISHRLGSPHDAFLRLGEIGNAESVPLLIRALKWQNPGPPETRPCTTSHCIDALRNLTGNDFDDSPAIWTEWWQQTGSKLPENHFYPRKRKKEKVYPAGE